MPRATARTTRARCAPLTLLACWASVALAQPVDPQQQQATPASITTIAPRAQAVPAWSHAPINDAGAVVLPLLPVRGPSSPLIAAASAWTPDSTPRVTTTDGQRLRTETLRLVVAGASPHAHPWFGPAPAWRTATASDPITLPSVWILVVETDGPSPSTIEVAGRTVTVLPPTGQPDRINDAPLDAELAQALQADPTRAWITTLFSAPKPQQIAAIDPGASLWAEAETARWHAALAAIAQADDRLAQRVVSRLTLRLPAELGSWPIWPVDRAQTHELLREVLAVLGRPDEIALAATAWLERTAEPLVWVRDDAPAARVDNLPCVRVTVVAPDNAGLRATLVGSRGPVRTAVTIPPNEPARTLLLPVDDRAASDTLVLRSGDLERSVLAVTAPLPLSAPGFTTPDFFDTLDQASLLAGTRPAPTSARRTRAAIHRLDAERWQIVVECLVPPGARADPAERVLLWVGAQESGQRPRVHTPNAPATETSWSLSEEGRWLAGFVIDEAQAIDALGLFRIALARTDEDGFVQSWPRPALPDAPSRWERTGGPGRLALDPSAWRTAQD